MGKIYAVFDCETNSSNKTGIPSFQFPEKLTFLECGLTLSKQREKSFTVLIPFSMICARHFIPEYYCELWNVEER